MARDIEPRAPPCTRTRLFRRYGACTGAHASPRTGAAVVMRGYAHLVEPASVLIMVDPDA
jgi:hypothetical protein